MSTISPLAVLPARGHHSAPKFTGEGEYIDRFFDEVEAVTALISDITDEEKIRWTMRLLDNPTHTTWKNSIPQATGDDWKAFKAAARALYPNSDDVRRYSKASLKRLARLYSERVMSDKQVLERYHLEFSTMSNVLKSQGQISDSDIDEIYFSGFDPYFQRTLVEHLQRRDPVHHPDDPYPQAKVLEVARFLLYSPVPSTIGTIPTPPLPVPSSASLIRQEQPGNTAIESAIVSSIASINKATESMAAMMQQFSTMMQASHPPAQPQTYAPIMPQASYVQPAAASQAPPPNRNGSLPPRCAFCYDTRSHFRVFQCPIYQRMSRQGWVHYNENRRLTLPNGLEITRALRGGCFQEQIENWRVDNRLPLDTPDPGTQTGLARDAPPHMTSAPPVASTNMITVSNFNYGSTTAQEPSEERFEDSPYDDDDIDEQIEMAQTLLSTLMKQKKVERKKEVRFQDSPSANTRSSTSSSTTAPAPAVPITPKPVLSAPTQTTQLREALDTGKIKPMPQYRYQSNAEDPKLTSDVITRALDAPVTLTQRELLSLAPDLRRHFRDLTMTKRIAPSDANPKTLYQDCSPDCYSQHAASFFHGEPSPEPQVLSLLTQTPTETIAANDMETLRVIPLKFDNGNSIECILDSGSQVISMRRSIWESLALPLRLDEGIVMESANLTTNKTMGLARNVRASIADMSFYLQIQVVENAPYDILLGRPFHCLLAATTNDYADGRQDITITDPNSGTRLTIPTAERRVRCCPNGHMQPPLSQSRRPPSNTSNHSFHASRNH
ncbi:hypothetical protein ONZ45_g13169 [Pleurotus djamor]|nr:hypothetical protein ONZ45_g13169 [Pleurotus djamor]